MTYLEVGKNSNWRDELYASAEKSVTEKLIFYYIIKNENFIPSDEEFDAMFDEKVDEMLGMVLEQMKLTEDSFDTKEEYEAELNELREALLDEKEGYGYDYFAEQVYYEYGMGKIVAMATVVGS